MKIATLALAVALLALPAGAHEWTMPDGRIADAGWIEEHHEECCGKRDCFPVPASDLTLTPAGWKVRGHATIIPEDKVIKSRDGKAWKCVEITLEWVPDGPRVRCLFLPGAGV